jgi:hypothetical protein
MSVINPLGDLCGYSKFLKLFEKNKDIPWSDWLEFKELFGKPGKQGIVGLLKTKEPDENGKERLCVFKMSQHIDNLTIHENGIMQGLNELAPYCPHFCKSFGTIECSRNPKTTTNANPFNLPDDVKYSIKEDMLLQEYVDKSNKFYNYIRSPRIEEDVLYSVVKQVLLAISFAQRQKKFSHYDLHSLNIMMKKCNKDVVFVYVIDEDNQICVPTLGHFPVIIDFGFSYIGDMEDGPLWPTLGHTAAGFTSDRFDRIVDPKLFLTTVSDEIKEARNSKKSKIFRRLVKNMFKPLTIDFETGWDTLTEIDATDELSDLIDSHSKKSFMFTEHTSFCIDIIQSLIILPMEQQDHENPQTSFKLFVKEWIKIENEITNVYYNLYILKGIVYAARHVRTAYMDPTTSVEAVVQFKTMVNTRIDEVSKFCYPKKLNYEKLLCSLCVFATNMEGIYYDMLDDDVTEKEKEYEKMPLKSIEHMYAGIDSNIPTKYVYNSKTTVFMMNSVKKETSVFTLDKDDIELINKTHSICRGSVIYDIYNTNKK